MNRRFAWAWGLVTLAIATIVGFVAYHAGQTSQIVTTTGGNGRYIYPGYWGFGFFPLFGLFWIFLIGFLIVRLFTWRSWGGWGGYGGGYWHQHPHEHGDTPTTTPPSGQQSV